MFGAVAKKILVVFMMLLLVDQSIDLDHLGINATHAARYRDDIDSFSELIIEMIAGNNNLISEHNDDDSRSPISKSAKTFNLQVYRLPLSVELQPSYSWPVARNDQPVMLATLGCPCCGHCRLVTQPPEA